MHFSLHVLLCLFNLWRMDSKKKFQDEEISYHGHDHGHYLKYFFFSLCLRQLRVETVGPRADKQKSYQMISTFETTASHQSSTAAKECDSPTANGVTEHEKLTSHVFNLHPHIILHNKASTTTYNFDIGIVIHQMTHTYPDKY